ncbi:hypothetical protein RvY_11570 [Ramazzottius varieornatus]|uniref:Uncharacterized protein n=1 Tax=Ramazzottius varieornatus TaxID=947166 RepID=A0A1D1VQD3_RAMVA|nr:hypothetical protein RvY_11570 [Ramazzottius varieornatus]
MDHRAGPQIKLANQSPACKECHQRINQACSSQMPFRLRITWRAAPAPTDAADTVYVTAESSLHCLLIPHVLASSLPRPSPNCPAPTPSTHWPTLIFPSIDLAPTKSQIQRDFGLLNQSGSR